MKKHSKELPSRASERYELRSLLGEGGMGRVYLAHDRVLHRDVALKVVSLEKSKGKRECRRFRREISLLSKVTNVHVVSLLDYEEEKGRLCFTMEYVQGQSLADLARHSLLPVPEVVEYMVQLADGLAAVHEKGIIHRDIKLENLVVLPDKSLKLVDFGLAILDDEELTRLTREGHVIGTLGYIAPEVLVEGEAREGSDVFQMAVVFYRLLTGRFPFPRDKYLSVLLGREAFELKKPSFYREEIDSFLDDLITCSLSLSVEERVESAAKFCQSCANWLEGNDLERFQVLSRTLTYSLPKVKSFKRWLLFLIFLSFASLLCLLELKSRRDYGPSKTVKTPHHTREVTIVPRATALHIAARRGDLALLNLALEKGTALDLQDHVGRTALHYAAINDFRDLAHALLKAGVEVDPRDSKGNRALHYAAETGDLLLSRQLIRYGASPSCRNNRGSTPLHFAAACGDEDMFADLIRLGADPSIENLRGASAFDVARRSGHLDISAAENLGSFIAMTMEERPSPLVNAVEKGDVALARILLKRGANVDELLDEGMGPIHRAVEMGEHEIALLLLRAGASIDSRDELGRTPLHIAVINGSQSMVALLLREGAFAGALDSNGESARAMASRMGRGSIAKLIDKHLPKE